MPEAVIDAWNELVSAKFDGRSATVEQDAAVRLLVERMGCDRSKVFDSGWLEVEPLFRLSGWDVAYDKPGYNETYPATFKFTVCR